jgi:hypothetical protein
MWTKNTIAKEFSICTKTRINKNKPKLKHKLTTNKILKNYFKKIMDEKGW